MPFVKKTVVLLLCAVVLLCAVGVSAEPANAIEPFRINVSRVEMGDATYANTGCYFVFDGQEKLLVNNSYSRAILAKWKSSRGCYEVIGSLGYANLKTEWDIPADGFALIISAFAESNLFDAENFKSIEGYFSYSSQDYNDYLVGQPLFLYNIDLQKETAKTTGTEGTDDFSSSSYICVGAPDKNSETAPYNGDGVFIEKSQDVPLTADAYSKMYLSSFSAYRGEGAPDGNIYGQCFFIMPDDENIADELTLADGAFACVIEETGGEYRIIHTAMQSDKTDWAELWLTDPEGILYDKRFILACHIKNDEADYPNIYRFEMQNWRTAYYKLNPETDWGGNGSEGAAYGMQVFFYNVDFLNRKVMTDGVWGTEDFSSKSYVTFGAKDYPKTTEMTATASNETVTTGTTDPVKSPFADRYVMLAICIAAAAALVLIVLLIIRSARKKKDN